MSNEIQEYTKLCQKSNVQPKEEVVAALKAAGYVNRFVNFIVRRDIVTLRTYISYYYKKYLSVTGSRKQLLLTYRLYLPYITSMPHIVVLFVTTDLQTLFHTRFIDMVIICHHTKFHLPNSNGLLVVTVSLKAK
jgi:hypothetical protein